MVSTKNTRSIPTEVAGLDAADVKRLRLKWAFAFPNGQRSFSQPAFAGGALFVSDDSGGVYALDADTGCVHWRIQVSGYVRTPISIRSWSKDKKFIATKPVIPTLYFGDRLANAYAVNASNGKILWQNKVSQSSKMYITGGVTLHKDRLYVPIAGKQDYRTFCCELRGAIVALDAETGTRVWKSYTVPEPEVQYINAAGIEMKGPSGAGVWSAPTIDAQRGQLYIGTGENNSQPAVNGGSIIAMDLKDGHIKWVMQASPDEAYNRMCTPTFSSASHDVHPQLP